MTLKVTFPDGTIVTLHNRAAVEFLAQCQRGGWVWEKPGPQPDPRSN